MKVIITPWDVPPPIPAAVHAGIIAAPGGQANATALTARYNIVSVASPGWAVKLQAIQPAIQKVFNRSGVQLTIMPLEGTAIESGAINAPVTIANGGVAEFTFDGTQTWIVG